MAAIWSGAKRAIRQLPGVRVIDRAHERAHFMARPHRNGGVFRSFDEARAWLPPSRGFDAEELADEYINVRIHRIFVYDYPVIFWLSEAIRTGARSVLDVGGSVGVHYIAYRRVLAFPDTLTWTIAEVPAMVKIGRELAQRVDAPALRFIDIDEIDETRPDAFVSCGAIQYLEPEPDQIIARTVQRPGHIILNKVPVYDLEPFVTAQNLGKGLFAPHHVYNRADLVYRISALGYDVVDQWQVLERDLYLVGRPEKSLPSYSGLYFVAKKQ
jgi:putative methyltransferase (TIGR04325 family)